MLVTSESIAMLFSWRIFPSTLWPPLSPLPGLLSPFSKWLLFLKILFIVLWHTSLWACSTPYSSDILSQRRWRLASSCSWQASDSTATHPESTIDPSPEPVGLSSLPEVRCSYLWHPYGLCLTQHSAFLAIVHSSLKPQNDSEAARIPQWQQAMSEELPVLQKTSFITISDREGFQTSSWRKDHYWGKFRLTLGIDSEKTFAPLAKVTFVGLWLQLPRWESSLRSSEMWGMLFWVENYIRRFTCHLRQGDQFIHI